MRPSNADAIGDESFFRHQRPRRRRAPRKGASRIIAATRRARWRVYTSRYVLDEVAHVLVDDFDFSPRLASLTQRRIVKYAALVRVRSHARVIADPKDSPILKAALSCAADYLVSNDRHLLALNPFEGLQIVSMDAYYRLLQAHGWIS